MYLCDPKERGRCGNAIKTTTGLVREVCNRFVQAGSLTLTRAHGFGFGFNFARLLSYNAINKAWLSDKKDFQKIKKANIFFSSFAT